MNEYYLKKAYANEPKLIYSTVSQYSCGRLVADDGYFGWHLEPMPMPEALRNGDSFCLDFGDHWTGKLSFRLGYLDNYPDAPVQVKIKFAETTQELAADFDTIETGLCRSWLQQEMVYIDYPMEVKLPRRFAFRYVQVTVIATPQVVTLSDFMITTETCADLSVVPELKTSDPELIKLDRIGVKTTAECMQRVFEDGPKRDHRLWLGDLRIEGLVNYLTFRNMDIVKKGLYLFAAAARPGQRMPGAIYEDPHVALETKCILLDYALFFGVSLNEYHLYTGDDAIVDELFPIAHDQFVVMERELDARNLLIHDRSCWWCFVDHVDTLRKSAAAQAIAIYSAEHMRALCARTGRAAEEAYYAELIEKMRAAAIEYLYDRKENIFRSGPEEDQLSVHSQIWMILADCVTGEKAKALLRRSLSDKTLVQPVSPYMHHFVLEAMMHLGLKEEAREFIMGYWGEMARLGADTYWEVYIPGDRVKTTYGKNADPAITSYCHGWSCSVTYFIRKYFAD